MAGSRDELVSLVFHDLLGIKYHSSVCDDSGSAEDLAIEVIDSDWLRKSCEADGLDPFQFRHLIIGFNERLMVLEILFRTIEEANNPIDRSVAPSNVKILRGELTEPQAKAQTVELVVEDGLLVAC